MPDLRHARPEIGPNAAQCLGFRAALVNLALTSRPSLRARNGLVERWSVPGSNRRPPACKFSAARVQVCRHALAWLG